MKCLPDEIVERDYQESQTRSIMRINKKSHGPPSLGLSRTKGGKKKRWQSILTEISGLQDNMYNRMSGG